MVLRLSLTYVFPGMGCYLAYLNMLGSSSVQFIDKSIYYWDLGMSSTVATTNVEDADNVTFYSDALNTCGWLP